MEFHQIIFSLLIAYILLKAIAAIIKNNKSLNSNNADSSETNPSTPSSSIARFQDVTSLTQPESSKSNPSNHNIFSTGIYDSLDFNEDADATYRSIAAEDRIRIDAQLSALAETRERSRQGALQTAKHELNELSKELLSIERAIAENDAWLKDAQHKKIRVSGHSVQARTTKAERLYSKKKSLQAQRLPELEEKLQTLIANTLAERSKEPDIRRDDLKRLLKPLYKAGKTQAQTQVIAKKKGLNLPTSIETKHKPEIEARDAALQSSLDEIKQIADARSVKCLVHFTPIENVGAIINFGLRSRSALINQNHAFTDQHRIDGWLDWISLSIGFPNYKMFYSKQRSMGDRQKWAIVVLRCDILWELQCKFLPVNAASSRVQGFRSNDWSTPEALADMFSPAPSRQTIPDCFPTDPQAEVMVAHSVPYEYISAIAVQYRSDAARLPALGEIPLCVRPDLFKPRSDFNHWGNKNPVQFASNHY